MAAVRLMAVGLLTALGVAQGSTQEIGDPRRGQTLARDVCAPCHAVEAGALASPIRGVPSFVAIARSPGMSEIALNAALHTSHRDMPNLILSAPEARNVITYIMSLR